MERALELAKGTGLQARDVSKKEMAKLQRLRKKAAAERDVEGESAAVVTSSVKLSPVISSENIQ